MINLKSITFKPDKVWFTSDTHFWHSNIIEYAHRPFSSVEEMNETLIANWNAVVPRDGVVFHLGDFAFGSPDLWNSVLDRLKGKIYLVAGNHDGQMLQNTVMERFVAVDNQMEIKVDKQKIILNHYPFLCWSGEYRNTWQLFGHVHSGPMSLHNDTDFDRLSLLLPNQYDVGVDNNGFKPVSFAEVQTIISKQNYGTIMRG